jgi:gliding motility-associated-like protein
MTASASLGGTLNWYDDAALTNLVGTGNSVAPANTVGTVTYYVTETATGCTSSVAQVTITINSTPFFTLDAFTNPTACGSSTGSITIGGLGANQTVDLTVDSGSGPVVSTVTTTAGGTYELSGLAAGNYNITLTLGSCSFTLAVPVALTDPNSPTFTVTSTNPTSCGGNEGSITLSGLDPNTTYDISYNDGGVVNLNGVTTDASGDFVITGLDAGSYSSFVVVLSGCTGTFAGPVVLSDPGAPAAPVAGTDAVYCDGDALADLTATAGAGGDLTWYEDAGLSVSIGTGTSLTPANTIGVVTYYVTETVAGCESPATAITVEINTTPSSPLVVGGATYCDGEVIADITTSPTSGGVIEWYDDAALTNLVATGNSVTPNGTIGTQTWFVTEVLGNCSSATVTPVSVTVNPTPTFTVSASTNPSACGAADGEIIISGLDPNTSYEVVYNDASGSVNLGTITTDASGEYVISGLGAGSYTNVTVTLGNCDFTLPGGAITLTDPGAPTFSISAFSTTSCAGSDGGFTITGLDPNETYDVSYNDGTGVVNATLVSDASGNIAVNGLPAGTYTQITVAISGCVTVDPASFVVTDPATPAAPAAGTDASYCEGDVMADMTATPGAGGTITWYADAALTTVLGTGNTLSPLAVNGTTTYYVTETSAACESTTATVAITINATAAAPLVSADQQYCAGETFAAMSAAPSVGGTITWYADAGLTSVLGTGNNLFPSNVVGTTTYYVSEVTGGVCAGTPALINITVVQCDTLELVIPTGFTPDGDGVNDVWEIVNLGAMYPNAIVKVYNRWGNPLFESAPGYPQPWDGTFNGERLPVASYYFYIEFNSGREPETGSVTIILR